MTRKPPWLAPTGRPSLVTIAGMTPGSGRVAEQAEARQVVAPGELLAPLHEGADRRRCGVEDRHPVVFDDLPEPALVGPVGGALVHHARGPIGEGAVDQVRVAGHPAD